MKYESSQDRRNDINKLRLQISECGKSLESCGSVSVTIARLNPCGSLTPKEQMEVASRLVTACNHHAELVAALDDVLDLYGSPKTEWRIARIKSLLNKVKGQP